LNKTRGAKPLAFLLCLTAPATAGDVVSLNLCTDEYLVALAPDRVAALSPLARDPALSVVAEQATKLPWVRPDAEAVLRLKPAMVLAASWGAQTTLAALERRDVRVERIALPDDFSAIAEQTVRLADLLGVPARGRALVQEMQARLASAHKLAPVPTLGLEPRGYTAGPGSLEDAVLRAAGLRNVGTGGRIGLEGILAHPPALLVVSTAPATPSLATDFVEHPALRGIARRAVPPALMLCGGPWTAEAVTVLTR